MRVAVTGGAGSLGTVVLRRLAAAPEIHSLVCIDLRPPIVASTKIEQVLVDVRSPDLARHFAGCDAVVHLAFLLLSDAPPEEIEEVNVEGSKNVFRSAAATGVEALVYCSSIAAFGVVPGHPDPIVESTPRRHQPAFGYSSTKFLVEEFLDEFEREHPDLAVVRLRPAICIGRHQSHPLGRALRRGAVPDVGAPVLPLVWDEDVAEAVYLALGHGRGGAFNLAASDPLPAAELARSTGLRHLRLSPLLLDGLTRASPLLTRLGAARVSGEWRFTRAARMVVSAELARAELGWRPTCPSCVDVVRRCRQQVPHRTDRRLLVFMALVRFLALTGKVRGEGASVTEHLALTGPSGGDFEITGRAEGLRAKPGIPRPPDSVVTLDAALFLALLAGEEELSAVMPTGAIQVEGRGEAPQLFAALVIGFRALAGKAGARGSVARWMSRWLGRRAAG